MVCQSIAPTYSFKYLGTQNDVTPNGMDKIINFNSTLGLGDQSSTFSLEMAGHQGTTAHAGRIAIFTCNNFQFGGIIKNIVHTENSGGQKTKIDMVCCKELLAGYDLMLNQWYGSFDRVRTKDFIAGGGLTIRYRTDWNGKNVHNVIEGKALGNASYSNYGNLQINQNTYGTQLPDVGNCSFFGLSTQNKMPIGNTTYLAILNALCKERPQIYTAWGEQRPTVFLDSVRDLATIVPYAGTSAYKMTLLELVNNVCNEAGYDFYFWTSGDGIRFRFVNKRVQTVFGSVKNKIETAKTNNKVISSSIGAEFKNEKTNRIVIGSKVNYVKEIYLDPPGRESNGRQHEGAMVLGFNNTGYPIMASRPDFELPINTSTLAASLWATGYDFSLRHMLSELELLATGTLAMWKIWGIMYPKSISRSCMSVLGIDWEGAYDKLLGVFNSGGDLHAAAKAAEEAVKVTTEKTPAQLIYDEICYPWIKNFYDTYYGKYYMVIIPKPTCFFDPSGFIKNTGVFLGQGGAGKLADEATDSGWPDRNTDVIGLTNWSMFYDSNLKTSCFCGIPVGDTLTRGDYDWRFDPSAMTSDFIYEPATECIYTKAEVDGRMYNINGKLGVLIKMPGMIPQRPLLNGKQNNMGLRASELLFGGGPDGFGFYGGTTNFSYLNVLRETFAAGRFTRIAIPMKSQFHNYGPYMASSGAAGGVDIQYHEDLNPWQYGGYYNMNQAGERLAEDGLPSRTKYESGTITVAEAPIESLGAGEVGTGPLLSSISVRFDSSGATTTYNYETYTQKFGNNAENMNNFVKTNIGYRRDNYNILKNVNMEILRAFTAGLRQQGNIRKKYFEQFQPPPLSVSSASLNPIMYLSYPDQPSYDQTRPSSGGTSGQSNFIGSRTYSCQELENDPPQSSNLGSSRSGGNNPYKFRLEVGIDKVYSSDYFQDKAKYRQYSVISLDMLFTPVSTLPNNFMSCFVGAYGLANYPKNGPFPRMPPFVLNDGIHGIRPIMNIHLNPYTTASWLNLWGDPKGSSYGFQAEYISYGTDPANTHAATLGEKSARDSALDIRGAALRGPLVLQSWGYDTNGKPIPNTIDKAADAKRGLFQYMGNRNEFMQNWLANPETWPVGPIDLRWDRERGCWVSPPSERLVIAQLLEDLTLGGMAEAMLIDPIGDYYPNSYSSDTGGVLQGSANAARIYIYDVLSRPILKGSRVIAYHWGRTADYIPLMVADTYAKDEIESCCTDSNKQDPTSPCYEAPANPGQPSCETLATPLDGPIMVEGWNQNAQKTLYDISKIFISPDLKASSDGKMQVLGFSRRNTLGWPCLTGIPIVDCTGNYPGYGGGGPNDPIGPIPI